MARKRAKALWQDSHPGAVWTQQLSISMSQWKTTVENETEEEEREREEQREGHVTESAFYLVSRDEARVNGDRVKLTQTLHFHSKA